MIGWLVLSAMLVIALILSVRPFLMRGAAGTSGRTQDVAMFRDQITELDADVARGVMTEAEAAATRREIEQRLLAAAKQKGDGVMADASDKGRTLGLAIVSGWVVIGSVGLYALMQDPNPRARVMAAAQAPQPAAPAASDQQLGSVDAMITQMAARLDESGGNADEWRLLGWSYLRTGNYPGAATAFQRSLTLNDEDAELHALYGEALTRMAGGRIEPPAMQAFEASLARAPGNPRAGFFKGMALDQAGDTRAALDLWLAILDRSPQNADWVPGLVDRIKERAAATGYDIAGHPKLSPPQELRGPSAEDVQAAMELDATDRTAMIRGMVDGLAARLENQPNDPAGWARLIRSYGVLGETDAARKALQSARAAIGPDAPGRQDIENAATFLTQN